MRLDKIILEHLVSLQPPSSSYSSKLKKHSHFLIVDGSVLVDGVTCLNPKLQVIPKLQSVSLSGVAITVPQSVHAFYKFSKPKGFICQRHPREPTVYDLLPESLRDRFGPDLVTWGRLDNDTTGVLIWGTDGGVSHLVLRPSHAADAAADVNTNANTKSDDINDEEKEKETRHEKWKTYVATLAGSTSDLAADAAAKLKTGVTLPGTSKSHGDENSQCPGTVINCLPALLRIRDNKRVELRIQEGFYHQVKRMVKFVGGEVVELHRVDFGGIKLDDDMHEGDFRELTKEEISILVPKNLCGYEHGCSDEIETRRRGTNLNYEDAKIKSTE